MQPFISYPSPQFDRLTQLSRETPESIRKGVANILRQVARNGDAAVKNLTRKFDGVRLQKIGISSSDLNKARVPKNLEKAGLSTLREVQAFARASMPRDWQRKNAHGANVGEKYDPIQRIGVYVPGGSVPLVSTVFMTVAIAKVAGVPEIVVCTPPPIAKEILWALRLCGATEVCQIGGAQAIAAMAYGTKSIRPVDKIFGPGNAYVTEAKRQVFGVVGIDLLAGPSELMVIADESTNPAWAAADLLAQAEHGSGRERVWCISASRSVLEKISKQVEEQSTNYPDNPGLREVLKKSTSFIWVKKAKDVPQVANILAPEHLQIMTKSPRSLADKIYTAGGVFLGNYTPTVLGDFVAGPSHTLPTAGAGRSFSGLRVMDFMRRTSLVEYSPNSLHKALRGVAAFAGVEQLPAHGISALLRLSQRSRS